MSSEQINSFLLLIRDDLCSHAELWENINDEQRESLWELSDNIETIVDLINKGKDNA